MRSAMAIICPGPRGSSGPERSSLAYSERAAPNRPRLPGRTDATLLAEASSGFVSSRQEHRAPN